MKAPAITVVGSNMIDLTSYLERCPLPGETVFGRGFAQGFGGKGANQAVMAALLGARVRMVTCIGDDRFAASWLDYFAEHAIDSRFIGQIAGEQCGVASIWVAPDGENSIVLAAGANRHLDRKQVSSAFEDDAVDVVLSQLEVPQEAIAEGFRKGRLAGAVTVLNPGPAGPIAAEVLTVTDWLIPNESELRLIAREMCGFTASDDVVLAGMLAEALGIQVVATLGDRGAVCARPGRASFEVSAPHATAIDTAGAGDAFSGTFSFGIGVGLPVEQAVRLAVTVASDSVTRAGTAASFARGDGLMCLVRSVLETIG